jgi:hypothetical protein
MSRPTVERARHGYIGPAEAASWPLSAGRVAGRCLRWNPPAACCAARPVRGSTEPTLTSGVSGPASVFDDVAPSTTAAPVLDDRDQSRRAAVIAGLR